MICKTILEIESGVSGHSQSLVSYVGRASSLSQTPTIQPILTSHHITAPHSSTPLRSTIISIQENPPQLIYKIQNQTNLFPHAKPRAQTPLRAPRLVLDFPVRVVDILHDSAARVPECPLAVCDARLAYTSRCISWLFSSLGGQRGGGKKTFADSGVDVAADLGERGLGGRLHLPAAAR